jgi:dipeptidyl aminopeptidase/acylaminoacyl peptidase
MFVVVGLLLLTATSVATGQDGYAQAPRSISEILDATALRWAIVDPGGTYMLVQERSPYRSISDASQAVIRLAGLRINVQTNARDSSMHVRNITLKHIATHTDRHVELPPNGTISPAEWSPSGGYFAVTNATPHGVELWLGSVKDAVLRRVPGCTVNSVLGAALAWQPDGQTLIVQTIPENRKSLQQPTAVPIGPNTQEGGGKLSVGRSADSLHNEYEENVLEYYGTAQLSYVNAGGDRTGMRKCGCPGLYDSVEPAPGGKYLLVTRVRKPYSHVHVYADFARTVELWNQQCELVQVIAEVPVRDQKPGAVPLGRRSVFWHPLKPATLLWVEALDGGDPQVTAPFRDRVMQLDCPPAEQPVEVLRIENRFAGMWFGTLHGVVMFNDYDSKTNWVRTYVMSDISPQASLIWSRNLRDRYSDPGQPLLKLLPGGSNVMLQDRNNIFMTGRGSTPEGDRPFLHRFNIITQETTELFRSGTGVYESVETALSTDASRVISIRESFTSPRNYYLRVQGSSPDRLTDFTDPTPALRASAVQRVTYRRRDGIQLSFMLHLPPGYKSGTRLPAILWAYPQEYTSAKVASQIAGTVDRFVTLEGPSQLFLPLAGYAVLDDAAMPVVGATETANNSFVDQIVADASAAIETASRMAVIDPDRVGVGGSSYGAFMASNLLAHSDLFKAGVAISGAYNRTLTPFGFQHEHRSLWEAPEAYIRMSPFFYADRIKAPLLLVHGDADDNPGTAPIQSERMYEAIRGNGGTVRLVMLPCESHDISSRESVEHVISEMVRWFDKYLKGR